MELNAEPRNKSIYPQPWSQEHKVVASLQSSCWEIHTPTGRTVKVNVCLSSSIIL